MVVPISPSVPSTQQLDLSGLGRFLAPSGHAAGRWIGSNSLDSSSPRTRTYEIHIESMSVEPTTVFAWGHQPSSWSAEVASSVDDLRPAFQRITELASLQANWDGYGAEPPSALAYARALQLILTLNSQSIARGRFRVPFTSAPIADGGLQVEWKGPNARIEVQAAPDGSFGYLIVAGAPGDREYHEADDLDLSQIVEVIHRIIDPK